VRRRTTLSAVVLAAVVLAAPLAPVAARGARALFGAHPATAADHLDAPTVSADRRVDISDFYAFRGAGSGHTVLVMDVNALSTPADTAGLRFAPDALYQFHIDTDGDALEDLALQVTFGRAHPDGSQPVTVSVATGEQAREYRRGVPIGQGCTSTGAAVMPVGLRGGGSAFAGPRDDPFFFDLAGANNNFQFTGTDTFAGTNVSAIVLEVPDSWLPGKVGIWASTARPGSDGQVHQVDRMGHPAVNNSFNHVDADKERFNQDVPSRDVADWTQTIVATEMFFGQTAEYGRYVAAQLLPDVLSYDPAGTVGYPNGRALADDVIDATLSLTTNGAVTSDLVDHNDVPFLASFPYLAAPH
jgi:uncharacterized protein DUF4331